MHTREVRTYELPYPPSVNHYWRRLRNLTLISREGRRFRARVQAILAAQRATPMQGNLGVTIYVYPPDGRRRDLDNVLKALLDALEKGGAYENDNQIAELAVNRAEVVPDGRILVQIVTLSPGHRTAPVPGSEEDYR